MINLFFCGILNNFHEIWYDRFCAALATRFSFLHTDAQTGIFGKQSNRVQSMGKCVKYTKFQRFSLYEDYTVLFFTKKI